MSPVLSDCPSLMLGFTIHYIQHSQAMLERGLCELAHFFFTFRHTSAVAQWVRTLVPLAEVWGFKSHPRQI